MSLFGDGFRQIQIETSGATINLIHGGGLRMLLH